MERKPSTDLEDSYDEEKLSVLKREIALPKSELFELVNHDGTLSLTQTDWPTNCGSSSGKGVATSRRSSSTKPLFTSTRPK